MKATRATVRRTHPTNTTLLQHGTFAAAVLYVADWQSGVVEPESTGSGLFIDAGDDSPFRLRGTLSGGRTRCGVPSEPVYYQPFERQYALLQALLTTRWPPVSQMVARGAVGASAP